MTDTVGVTAAARLREVEHQINALLSEREALHRILRADSKLRGTQLAEIARRELSQNGEAHYQDLADRLGAHPATLLTALHRHPGVRQVGRRTGVWRAA